MFKNVRQWSGFLLITALMIISGVNRGIREGRSQTNTMSDETAVLKIIEEQSSAWNRGDAAAYSERFADDGTFTNIRGEFATGHQAFLKRHEVIFQGIFKNTTLQYKVTSLKFIAPDVAVVETLTSVDGMQGTLPGTAVDGKGRLRTRLLQVLTRQNEEWKIVAYHNVDVKPGVPVPEPK